MTAITVAAAIAAASAAGAAAVSQHHLSEVCPEDKVVGLNRKLRTASGIENHHEGDDDLGLDPFIHPSIRASVHPSVCQFCQPASHRLRCDANGRDNRAPNSALTLLAFGVNFGNELSPTTAEGRGLPCEKYHLDLGPRTDPLDCGHENVRCCLTTAW